VVLHLQEFGPWISQYKKKKKKTDLHDEEEEEEDSRDFAACMNELQLHV
jgi:hypothetical protein